MSEGFPPEYRTVLERYYRRLAEEKTAASGGECPANPRTATASAGVVTRSSIEEPRCEPWLSC